MEQRVNRIMTLLAGAGVGAGLLYLLDPNAGARRRALARDQAASALHRTRDLLGKAGRDLRHRAHDIAAATSSRLRAEEATADNIAPLQAGSMRPGVPFRLTQESWAPAMRVTVGTVGASLLGYGVARRDRTSVPLALLGLMLMTRSSAHRPFRRWLGPRRGPAI